MFKNIKKFRQNIENRIVMTKLDMKFAKIKSFSLPKKQKNRMKYKFYEICPKVCVHLQRKYRHHMMNDNNKTRWFRVNDATVCILAVIIIIVVIVVRRLCKLTTTRKKNLWKLSYWHLLTFIPNINTMNAPIHIYWTNFYDENIDDAIRNENVIQNRQQFFNWMQFNEFIQFDRSLSDEKLYFYSTFFLAHTLLHTLLHTAIATFHICNAKRKSFSVNNSVIDVISSRMEILQFTVCTLHTVLVHIHIYERVTWQRMKWKMMNVCGMHQLGISTK